MLSYPIPPYTADPIQSSLAGHAYISLADPSRQLLTPATQLASPILATSLISSPAMSGIHQQDNLSRSGPSPLQHSPLHSSGQPCRTPLNNGRTNELAVAVEEMNSRITRIMTEVAALQAQMQALQLPRSFSFAGASSHLGLGAATDALPPYLQ